jgi:arsenate reductase-like glutaredoxin family protein
MNHDITIYSTPTCSWCQAAKDYLHAREIEFDDIDGEIIVGFDRPRIDSLLDLN